MRRTARHAGTAALALGRVRQWLPEDLPPPVRAFLDAAAGAGFSRIDDFNDRDQGGGYGGEAVNIGDGGRRNTAMTYLTDVVRARPNLTIRCETTVERLHVGAGRVTGLHLVGGGSVEADEVALSAGVYGSPAILLRSGIGPTQPRRTLPRGAGSPDPRRPHRPAPADARRPG